ncbi:nuclear transport factor 2 family protein [Sphingomonas sp.]|uniref:nuclear transport factor 2 family protein n=1 Tax=Sphingomonas sp. TaxID=28214 RepID=UPI0025EC5677|nr:nuclear transport factor 2 family protein [Sphingomonas sp.]
MQKAYILAALLLGASAQGQAERPTAVQARAERYIIESEHQWAESVATNDAFVVKRILAEDFVWVLDGKVLNKAQAVQFAKEGPGDFVSNHPDYVNVRFFGPDTAVAQGSETWTKKSPARRGRFVWTDTWIRRNGKWQIVAAEDDVIPIGH